MKALVSGQAATAVLIDGGRFYSLNLEEPERITERQQFEVNLLLADATDIKQLDHTSRSAIIEELQLEWDLDRGLQLTLILLDSEEDVDTSFSAAECLDELLVNSSVRDYVANRLYSAPLPHTADLPRALKVCRERRFERLEEFLKELESNQAEIEERFNAWVNLPASLFGSADEKKRFHSDAVRFGAFRLFVTERDKMNWALLQLLSHPHFRGNAIARVVFREWAGSFNETATGHEFERPSKDTYLYDEFEDEARRERSGVSRREAFTQAEKQRVAIKKLLEEGDRDLALRFTEQLIANQRRNSEPEHIAKSLCDLAQFAKMLGSPELQLEFAKRATEEAPTDSWSYATVGDAYRALIDYPNALEAYHQAGIFGDERAALMGRAQVLKDMGQISEALELIDRCISDNPGDLVAQNSRASALADFGRFTESIKAYDEIINASLYDPITLTGRAEVLRDMGRFDESLEQLDVVIANAPDNPVPEYTRAEILREVGRLEEALQAFDYLKTKFPLATQVHASYARVLRDLGRFDAAIEQFTLITERHQFNPFGYLGLAETYKKIGDLNKAHEMFDVVIDRFPRVMSARTGKASIFMAEGHYSDAIRLLPSNLPATYNEWVAYHIRGMGYMRSGKLQRAEHIFERGVAEVPWGNERQYFKTALASLRIQQRRFEDSLELTRKITSPSIEPVAHVLTMHAMGELGDDHELNLAYQRVKESAAPVVIHLRDVLASRYMRRKSEQHEWSDDYVFIRECDSLLLAA